MVDGFDAYYPPTNQYGAQPTSTETTQNQIVTNENKGNEQPQKYITKHLNDNKEKLR
jgi:hypothetical protein